MKIAKFLIGIGVTLYLGLVASIWQLHILSEPEPKESERERPYDELS